MNYTKGEWKVLEPEIEPKRLIIDCRWQEEGKNYHRSICRTFGYCDTKEEELANANLIAAAPRMARLLEHLANNGWNAGVTEEAREILKTLT